jgi:Sodium/calcium exchanger protein
VALGASDRGLARLRLPRRWIVWLRSAVAEEVELESAIRPAPGRWPDAAIAAGSLVVVVAASVTMERAASALGNHFAIPEIVVGGLVLAAVTSLPNAVAAVYLAARGRGAATLSTALNSNLIDAPKEMSPERKIARRAAVCELRKDFCDKGGNEPFILGQNLVIEDRPCALHSVLVRSVAAERDICIAADRLPCGLDRALVLRALYAGCHVFVTCDKKILRCHSTFSDLGLAILSPAQLLERLEVSGELDECGNPVTAPSPDISPLARFYGAFAADCFEDLKSD